MTGEAGEDGVGDLGLGRVVTRSTRRRREDAIPSRSPDPPPPEPPPEPRVAAAAPPEPRVAAAAPPEPPPRPHARRGSSPPRNPCPVFFRKPIGFPSVFLDSVFLNRSVFLVYLNSECPSVRSF